MEIIFMAILLIAIFSAAFAISALLMIGSHCVLSKYAPDVSADRDDPF